MYSYIYICLHMYATHIHKQNPTDDWSFYYQKDDWLSHMKKNVKTVKVTKKQPMDQLNLNVICYQANTMPSGPVKVW